MQNICKPIGRSSMHITDTFIATVQISIECGIYETHAGNRKNLNLH